MINTVNALETDIDTNCYTFRDRERKYRKYVINFSLHNVY